MGQRAAIVGTCDCRKITLTVCLPRQRGDYRPRACDCDFCKPRGVSYVSDPLGAMRILADSDATLKRACQGSEQAEFLLCNGCGQLLGVVFHDGEAVYGAANAGILPGFGAATTASPRQLTPQEKTARWKQLWFRDVRIEADYQD